MRSFRRPRAQSGQAGVCRWSSDTIISVAIKTAGPQLTKAANQSSGSRKMLLSSCMAPFSTKTDVNGNDLEVVPLCAVSRMLNKRGAAGEGIKGRSLLLEGR